MGNRALCLFVRVSVHGVLHCERNMCRVGRVRGGRIRKVGPRRAPVDAATLAPVCVMAGERVSADARASASGSAAARSERVDMPREAMEAGNLVGASSLSLLRVWAHNARATYERMWRHHIGAGPTAFTFDVSTIEGSGSALEREKKLHQFAEANVRNEAEVWRMVQGSRASMALWRKSNRGGGSKRRMWRERNEAVVREIKYREETGTLFSEVPVATVEVVATAARAAVATTVVPGVHAEDAEASARARDVMPASYADDIRRIHRAMDAEEAGLRKPSANDRLVVARSAAFARGDLAQVARCDAQAERRRAVKRAARQRRNSRRAQARRDVADMQRDPCSDAEQ